MWYVDLKVLALGSILALTVGCTPRLMSIGQSLSAQTYVSPLVNVYTANIASSVDQLVLDFSNGAIASLSPSSVATTSNSTGVAATPDGKWLYSADQSGGMISEFSVGTGGVLTNIGAIPLTSAQNVWAHPNSQWLYASDWDDHLVCSFAIDPASGQLTQTGCTTVAGGSQFVAVEPTGQYAYAVNNGSYLLTEFTIDQSTGVLTKVGTIASGRYVAHLGIDPTGTYLYAMDNFYNRVWQYQIMPGGLLAALSPTNLPTGGSSPQYIAFATLASGDYAYITAIVSPCFPCRREH
jgi:6-phosphogluconolactonase (cycloisomerase 2 family)